MEDCLENKHEEFSYLQRIDFLEINQEEEQLVTEKGYLNMIKFYYQNNWIQLKNEYINKNRKFAWCQYIWDPAFWYIYTELF